MSKRTIKKKGHKLKKAIFFVGWLLSPLTFWNDIFVNIPLSYLCASLTVRVIPADFLLLVLIFYWFSNVLGLYLMYASGRKIIKEGRGGLARTLLDLFVTIAVYSGVLILLNKFGILRPI